MGLQASKESSAFAAGGVVTSAMPLAAPVLSAPENFQAGLLFLLEGFAGLKRDWSLRPPQHFFPVRSPRRDPQGAPKRLLDFRRGFELGAGSRDCRQKSSPTISFGTVRAGPWVEVGYSGSSAVILACAARLRLAALRMTIELSGLAYSVNKILQFTHSLNSVENFVMAEGGFTGRGGWFSLCVTWL